MIVNYIKSFTVYKIFENSIYGMINNEKIMLGRWNRNKIDIKTFYSNMDHCGDHICGSPSVLRQTYPKYFKKSLKEKY